jgi:hypothetical protein
MELALTGESILRGRVEMKNSFLNGSFRVLALFSVFLMLVLLVFLITSRIRNIEDRKNALLLAGQILTSWSRSDYPEIGVYNSTAVSGSVQYGIRRIVSEVSPGIREMHLYVRRNNDIGIELVKKFYDQEKQNL